MLTAQETAEKDESGVCSERVLAVIFTQMWMVIRVIKSISY